MMKSKIISSRVQDGKVSKLKQYHGKNSKIVDKNSEPVFNSYILTLYRRRKYSLCVSFIERNLNEDTRKNRHYQILLAACQIMLQNYKIAHQILDAVIASCPQESNNSFAFYNKGVAFYFEKKFRWSNIMFDMAIEADPSSQMDRARDMKIKVDLESRKAVIVLNKINDEDILNLNNSFERKVDNEITEITIDETETMKENNIEQKTPTKNPENKFLKCLLTEKNLPQIPEALPKSFVPKSSKDYFKKGNELYMSGSLQMALTSYRKSHELDPDYVEAEKMIEKVQKLINLASDSKTNLDGMDYTKVVEIATQALTLEIESNFINRKFYYQRGIALYHLGRNEESIKDYEKFEEINEIIEGSVDDNCVSK
jgi:tetratricopeptide (TPR) repeat protein